MIIDIQPTSHDDALELWGSLDRSIQAYSVRIDGELVCIAGITMEYAGIKFFQDIKQGVKLPKITVWRISKDIVCRVRSLGYTCRAPGGNGRYLLLLGFKLEKFVNNTPIYRLDPCPR